MMQRLHKLPATITLSESRCLNHYHIIVYRGQSPTSLHLPSQCLSLLTLQQLSLASSCYFLLLVIIVSNSASELGHTLLKRALKLVTRNLHAEGISFVAGIPEL